jgi:hypothetical protein
MNVKYALIKRLKIMKKIQCYLAVAIALFIMGGMLTGCKSKAGCEPFTVSAIDEFKATDKVGYVPFYIHRGIDALAVNSEEHENEYAFATYSFNNKSGEYNIKITTLLEDDGESTYKLFVNNKQVAQIQNEESDANYVERVYDYGNFKLQKGDVIGIAFNNVSNEKIIENE